MARGGARPGAGRPRGSIDKRTLAVQERLDRLGLDPLEGMAMIALGKSPCPVCKGEGSIGYEGSERRFRCEGCYGSGTEPVAVELRAKMMVELAQYVAPKRKAVDQEGSSTDQLVVEIVRFGDD